MTLSLVERRNYRPVLARSPRNRFCLITAAFISLVAVVASAAGLESGERSQIFARGLEAFDASTTPDDYRQSAAIWESLLVNGYRNGAVLYNIGNAYVRAGDYGKAIAAYRKGRPLRPRDPYLDANLRHAIAVAPGRLAESPPPWWTHVLFWSGWIAYPTKFTLAISGWVTAAGLAILALLAQWHRGYWISSMLVLIAIMLTVEAGIALVEVEWSHRAIVTSETVARKGIGKDYEPAFDQPLKDGAEFTILSENGDWLLGHFAGIGDGWLRKDHVARM